MSRKQLAIAEADYQQFRDDIDAARGYPMGQGTRAVTLTTFVPADELLVDDGTVYLDIGPQDEQPDDAAVYAALGRSIETAQEWFQPTGAGDAYAVGIHVTHNGQVWKNYLPANVWEPGVAGWRDPSDTPKWTQPVGAPDAWPLGAKVYHNDKEWVSNVPANVWEPGAPGIRQWDDITPEPPSTGTPEWQAGTIYAVSDLVTYEGSEYRCIQAHTAIVGWHPSAVPALWQAL